MEVIIMAHKMDKAYGVLDHLIELEPEELQWPILSFSMFLAVLVYDQNASLYTCKNIFFIIAITK